MIAVSVEEDCGKTVRIVLLLGAVTKRDRVTAVRGGERGTFVRGRGKCPAFIVSEEPSAPVSSPVTKLCPSGKNLDAFLKSGLPAIAEHPGLNPG